MLKKDLTSIVSNGVFRLICVYADKFPPYTKACMNFSSDYRLKSECIDGKTVFKVEYQSSLPKHFFSVLKDSNCVSSVSAIIAQNGGGKTSLARLFYRLSCGDYQKEECSVVIVFEQHGRIKVLTTIESIEFLLQNEKEIPKEICELWKNREIRTIDVYTQEYPFRFFYYSPYFTTESVVQNNGKSFVDISTTQLLTRPPGNLELLLRDGVLQTNIFAADEKQRVLEFSVKYQTEIEGQNRANLRDFSIPKPQKVLVYTFDSAIRHAVQTLIDKVKKCQDEEKGPQRVVRPRLKTSKDELWDPVGEFLRTLVKPVFENFSSGSFFKRAFMGYAACHFSECGMMQQPSMIMEYERELKRFLLEHYDEDGERFVNAVLDFLQNNKPKPAVNDYRFKSMPEANPAFSAFVTLQEMCDCSNVEYVVSDFRDNVKMKHIVSLVHSHSLSRQFTSYLRFDILPRLASGEMAFLSMFARLYYFVKTKTDTGEDVVLFMDEAETTLHPEWQRRIVNYIIKFLQLFLADRHFHVIFASHSPVLLSDIPAGNAVLMAKDADSVGVIESLCGNRSNTFGANIYNLFKDNFFLKHGAVGEFSRSKIETLLEHLANIGHGANIDKSELTKVAELIGDPVIAGYVNGLKELGIL